MASFVDFGYQQSVSLSVHLGIRAATTQYPHRASAKSLNTSTVSQMLRVRIKRRTTHSAKFYLLPHILDSMAVAYSV